MNYRNRTTRLLACLLGSLMMIAPLASCRGGGGSGAETTGKEQETTAPALETGKETVPETEPETNPGEEETDPVPTPIVVPEGAWGKTLANAAEIANKLTAYYTSGDRTGYHFENTNISADYPFTTGGAKVLTGLKSPSGGEYAKTALDVYMVGADGERYYASDSITDARPNIFRFGYYYYDLRILDQDFGSAYVETSGKDLGVDQLTFKYKNTSKPTVENGVVTYTIEKDDPYVYVNTSLFKASEYNAIAVTIRTTGSTDGRVYVMCGGNASYSEDKNVKFVLKNNGAFNTYIIPLDGLNGYTGDVKGLRFDIDGEAGDKVEISSLRAVRAESVIPTTLALDHTFHLYADKLNSVAHVVAKENTEGISAFGFETRIPVDTVAKLIVKDKNGTHDTTDGVDWDSAEYAAFDVRDAGVFGYILLPDKTSGRMEITVEDCCYVISQERSPAGGRMVRDEAFFIGQRIYTDENHSFDAFLIEAEFERNPITGITKGEFVGYDALRGAYTFALGSTGFNDPFFSVWNHHYRLTTAISNAAKDDRKLYVLTTSTSGCLENAVVLDKENLLMPLQPEVAKNFGGEHEEPLYNPGDVSYGEAIFPLVLSGGQTLDFTVLNLYQNWGNYPLKQLSSIQYIAPYYHLSTGVTETSCIAPWYVHGKSLWTLPDFRPMSAPFWYEMKSEYYGNQPQHTHGGYQYFLQYTDADKQYAASENIDNVITSAGPTYASVDMSYISDDGRIRVTYKQTEMPMTDEHRVYYEMTYEVLDDISFKDFRNDFSFYSAYAYAGKYRTVGYLDENNRFVTADTVSSRKGKAILLGDQCPFFALYHFKEDAHNGFIDDGNNTNLGCSVHSYDLTVGGEKYTGNLMMILAEYGARLTLDLGEVTLKKGDTMTINMIIGPWGYQLSDDDSNVRAIRESGCLHPLTVDVIKGEKMNSVFLPMVKSADGKTAEFTLSGGMNNVAVRVFGFDKLTAPTIYEKVNGEWVPYVVSSSANVDKGGNYHYYDGYAVYYEGDGTYSYSFVTDMDGSPRTFRIDCSADFTGWPSEDVVQKFLPLKGYSDADDLFSASASCGKISGSEKLKENGVSFVRLYGDGQSPEAYMDVYSNKDGGATGQYIVIKYRIPTDIKEKINAFEFFTSTVNTQATGDDFIGFTPTQDGAWHVLIMDAAANGKTFTATNGKYFAKYVRLDFFNTRVSPDGYVDVAFVGIDPDLGEILKLAKDMNYVTLVTADKETVLIDPATGEAYKEPEKDAEILFGAGVDMINGIGENGAATYANRGGGSAKGTDVFEFNNTTINGSYLVVSGWSMVEGGVEKYVFSVDGGKTWSDMTLYRRSGFESPSDAIVSAAAYKAGVSNFADREASRRNAVYQGPTRTAGQAYGENAMGVGADLSAYVGKTVTVLFAAVPEKDPDMRCVIAQINGVEVVGK